LEVLFVANETRVFVVDPDEIDRYARAIARIADKGHPAGSTELQRAVNTYGTAFQFLVMRRGADYGRALGMAAGDRAMSLVERQPEAAVLVNGDIGEIHERVCLAEEEALAREQENES
jgi:N-acetylglucosamine kinase-like BadF-type ATPase